MVTFGDKLKEIRNEKNLCITNINELDKLKQNNEIINQLKLKLKEMLDLLSDKE